MDLNFLKKNRNIFNAIVDIDNFKRLYLNNRLCNGFIKTLTEIPLKNKRQFNNLSKRSNKIIKDIISINFETEEQMLLLIQSCAIIQSNMLISQSSILEKFFSRYKNTENTTRKIHIDGKKDFKLKKSKLKSFKNNNKNYKKTSTGKSYLLLFVQNYAVIIMSIMYIIALLISIYTLYYIKANSIQWIFTIIILIIFLFWMSFKYMHISNNLSEALKIKNQYNYMTKPKMRNMNDFIKKILNKTK